MSNTDKFERTVVIRAPRSRVWKAVSDPTQFGTWFRAKIEGAFEPGAMVHVESTYPGHEGTKWEMRIVDVIPESLFALSWPAIDDATNPDHWTRVEFRLEEVPEGTRLTVVESGFDRLPPGEALAARRSNEEGWTLQVENIRQYVEV